MKLEGGRSRLKVLTNIFRSFIKRTMQRTRIGNSLIAVLLFSLISGMTARAGGFASQQAPALPKDVQQITSVEGFTEYRLANGLRVLLFPDQSKETITVNVTYMVGSRHENYGETGMAHLLEHLMYKGSKNHTNIPQELTEHGTRPNGSTLFDRTNYFETFAATDVNLDWAIKMEADRMVNSFIAKKDLDTEMTVVRNEYEAGENQPGLVVFKRIFAAAYDWHNYAKLPIGARSDIENVPIERLQAFYRRYYQPDNAVLLVAGKFDPAKTLQLIAANFGTVPRPARNLEPIYTIEPTQDGERVVTVQRVGDTQYVGVGYHVPAGSHPDFAAVDILNQVLADAPSGRLYKALVETKKAASVQSLNLTLNSAEQVGLELSEWMAQGDWRLFFLHRDLLKKVTAADVQRVAAAYLKPTNRTVGLFIPTEKPDRADIPPTPDVSALVKDYKGSAVVAEGEAFDPSPSNIETRTIRSDVPVGLKLALLPKKTRGNTVVAQMTFRFGDEKSLTNRGTAGQFAGEMLMRGTTKHTRQQIQDEFDKLKARVSVAPGPNSVFASIETVRDNLLAVLRLTTEILREPSFPANEFEQ